jgi:hypothetical protein
MGMSMMVDREFLYGLALYFRQVELSLHRCYDHEWRALIRLVSDSSPPPNVLDAVLLAHGRHAVPDESPNLFIQRCLCVLRIRTRTVFMTSKEVDETCVLLRELIRLFDGDYPERKGLSGIRLRFAILSGRLGSRLGWPPKVANAPIMHIGQAEHLRTFPLSHFAGREWPNPHVARR